MIERAALFEETHTVSVRLSPWLLRVVTSALLCAALLCAALLLGASAPADAPPVTSFVRAGRVAFLMLLAEPLPDADSQRLFAAQRARNTPPARRRGRQRRSRVLVFPLRALAAVKPKSPPTVSPEQLKGVAYALFVEALARRIQDDIGAEIVAQSDTMAAAGQLGIRSLADLNPERIARLMSLLKCDLLLMPGEVSLTVTERNTRTVVARVPLRSVSAATGAAGVPAIPVNPLAVGEAQAGRAILRAGYDHTTMDLARMAVTQAARRAEHTLRTGLFPPLVEEGASAALLPTSTPATLLRLTFAAAGRTVARAPAPNVVTNMEARFDRELLPLEAGKIVGPVETQVKLAGHNLSAADIWKPDGTPDPEAARRIAHFLKTRYLLATRVIRLETQAGAPDPTDTAGMPHAAVRARAEVEGVLFQGGTLLWQERTSADIAASANTAPAAAESGAVRDAANYAFIDLSKRFRRYRAGFEGG